jgi:hypothetical protein
VRSLTHLLALAAVLVACGARTGEVTVQPFVSDDDASVVDDAGTRLADASSEASDAAKACVWADASSPSDGSVQGCYAGRALLVCGPDSEFGAICVSDDLEGCPGQPSTGPCYDQCQPDEYAVLCGDLTTPVPISPPPPGCLALPQFVPGVYYCCPCGT